MRKKGKRTKRVKRESRKIDEIAWMFARVMVKAPPREHVHETFIDWEGNPGCIPAGTLTGYAYCQTCYYARGCTKAEINWRLSHDGKLTRNAVSQL